MTTYFVASSGSNSNSGTSSSSPWADTTNVNTTVFNAGDSVLFNGGDTISGSINLGVANWAVVAQTWNPSHINSDNTLSNSNLTVTHTAATAEDAPGFATHAFTTGKYYWETVVNGASGVGVGIGNISTNVGSGGTQYLGRGTDSVGYYQTGGVLNNNASAATWASYTSGSRICHALDLTNGKYWARVGTSGNWNNNAAGDPTNSTSAGNFSIPAGVTAAAVVPGFNTNVQTTDNVVAFFSVSSWVGTPPTGFGTMDFGTTPPTALSPVTFGSYGTGQGIISPGTSIGFAALNIAAIVIQNLTFTTASGTANGIDISNTLSGNTILNYLNLSNLTISGFGGSGIRINGNSGNSGFSNITISGCTVHDNTGRFVSSTDDVSGIAIYSVTGYLSGTACFQTINISNCVVYNNIGEATSTHWTGGGITIGESSNATITLCHTYNNGANGTGTVGIMIYDSTNGIMSFCESDHNHTGGTHDGDGFNLSSGLIEYCYAHDNDGFGYLFDAYLPGATTVMRYCIGQSNNVGSVVNGAEICISCYDAVLTVTLNAVNNTLYSAQPMVCVAGTLGNLSGKLANNIHYSAGGSFAITGVSSTGNPNSVVWVSNDYFTTGTFSLTWNGTTYTTFASWVAANVVQEPVAQRLSNPVVNPLLVNPGGGGTTNGYAPGSLSAYKLQSSSTMAGTGKDISTLYGINVGSQDYYGNSIPTVIGTGYSVGAFDAGDPFFFTVFFNIVY